MKSNYIKAKIKSLFHKNSDWQLPTDIELMQLKGRVKSIKSFASEEKKVLDENLVLQILSQNNFDKIFNPYGFLMQHIDYDMYERKIKEVSSFEYKTMKEGFSQKEKILTTNNMHQVTIRCQYLYSTDRILIYKSSTYAPNGYSPSIEITFDPNDNKIRGIHHYEPSYNSDRIVPFSPNENKQTYYLISKTTVYNKKNQVIAVEYPMREVNYLLGYYYKKNKLIKVQAFNNGGSVNYEKTYEYNNSKNVEKIIWSSNKKTYRTDSCFYDRKGNWIKKVCHLNKGGAIKIKRKIEYYT